MRLPWKISGLIALCVLFAVLSTAFLQSSFFTRDQEAYQNDLHLILARFNRQELERRMDLLHEQAAKVIDMNPRQSRELLKNNPTMAAIRVWKKMGKKWLLEKGPGGENWDPSLLNGKSHWTLMLSPLAAKDQANFFRWIGRYQRHAVVFDLSAKWLDQFIQTSHGVKLGLLNQKGKFIYIPGEKKNLDPDLVNRALSDENVRTKSLKYGDAQDGFLGTFERMNVDPPVFIGLFAPQASINAVIYRTFQQTFAIVVASILLALCVGILLARNLTQPLSALTKQSQVFAQGKFKGAQPVEENRKDEVGVLSKAFHTMGQKLDRLQSSLRHSERLATVGQFSAGIAHKVKNPLGAIIGHSDIVRMKVSANKLNDQDLDKYITTVKTEAGRASQTISELMKFARKEDTPDQKVNLNELIKSVASSQGAAAKMAGVEIHQNLCSSTLHTMGSPDYIRQAIESLVENAIQAMKDSPEKTLTLALASSAPEEEPMARIFVTDTGPGIPEEIKERIFEPFFTTKTVGFGTGLGLSMCRDIVLSHKGELKVESQPNGGTIFSIHLPLVD